MKVLMISTDRKIFEAGSDVRARMIEYGGLVDHLTIVVFNVWRHRLSSENLSDRVIVYPTNSLGRLTYVWRAVRLAKKLYRHEKFDLITTQDPFETGLVGWCLKKSFGLVWQPQIHTDLFHPNFTRHSLLNYLRVKLARWLLPQADSIRVVSEKIKNDLIRELDISASKIFVLPVWVDVDKLKNSPIRESLKEKFPEFKKIIFMASRLTPEKNISLAIQALADLSVVDRNRFGLVIAGEGPCLGELKRLVASLGLTHRVIFIGWAGESLAGYYKTADVFLLTSDFEGYGRTLIEASACGLPVISTDVGMASEIGATLIRTESDLMAELRQMAIGVMLPVAHLSTLSRKQYLERLKSVWSVGLK